MYVGSLASIAYNLQYILAYVCLCDRSWDEWLFAFTQGVECSNIHALGLATIRVAGPIVTRGHDTSSYKPLVGFNIG